MCGFKLKLIVKEQFRDELERCIEKGDFGYMTDEILRGLYLQAAANEAEWTEDMNGCECRYDKHTGILDIKYEYDLNSESFCILKTDFLVYITQNCLEAEEYDEVKCPEWTSRNPRDYVCLWNYTPKDVLKQMFGITDSEVREYQTKVRNMRKYQLAQISRFLLPICFQINVEQALKVLLQFQAFQLKIVLYLQN
jgi:hypothetical protein